MITAFRMHVCMYLCVKMNYTTSPTLEKCRKMQVHTCTHTYTHTYRKNSQLHLHEWDKDTHMHTWTHTYIHTCIPWSFPRTFFYTDIHTFMYTYIHVHIHTCMHTLVISTNFYTDIHTFMYTYIHTCTHTYIHTCIPWWFPRTAKNQTKKRVSFLHNYIATIINILI
jgi:hypothetical protein